VKLKELNVGSSARILGYAGSDKRYRQKLLRMGLIKGEILTITRKAPMGDPIEITIKGYNLTLRKAEADALNVEEVI
jgi:ferrous iron transport protein A